MDGLGCKHACAFGEAAFDVNMRAHMKIDVDNSRTGTLGQNKPAGFRIAEDVPRADIEFRSAGDIGYVAIEGGRSSGGMSCQREEESRQKKCASIGRGHVSRSEGQAMRYNKAIKMAAN